MKILNAYYHPQVVNGIKCTKLFVRLFKCLWYVQLINSVNQATGHLGCIVYRVSYICGMWYRWLYGTSKVFRCKF